MDKNIPTSNVMKDTFGWEVPQELVPIPSEGKIYNPDSTLYGKKTVQIKAMTAKEEDILTSQAFLKEGTVIQNLIKCVEAAGIHADNIILQPIASSRSVLTTEEKELGVFPVTI